MNTYVQQLKEEYEKRLRGIAERSLHGEKERRRQLGFQFKQVEAQLRRVQRDNESMEKQLKIVRKCALCSHLDQRSKSYHALNELLHGSVAALEPNVIASVNVPSHDDELKAVKIANNNLQQCVDKLQSMLLKKEREALVAEKYHSNAIWEREQQIVRLQKEANQHAETKLKALLKERTELLNRINRLEKENENRNVVRNEPHKTTGKAIESRDFLNIDPDDPNLLKEKEAAVEKHPLLSSYEKLLQRCECLETELDKRRKTEHDIIKK
ncbi:hypothetical protein DINM_002033 [Dirofilaria immitis]|nr:hypothetical protein [Dirofilaria immitis]